MNEQNPTFTEQKPMLIKIVLVAAAVLVVLAIFVCMRPTDFRITREIVVAGPPSAAFAQVNDFHKWDAWSPWAKLDPACKNTYEGSPSGAGAIFSWSGNNKVGQGRMTILESRPNEL